jgi:hypothetical protein
MVEVTAATDATEIDVDGLVDPVTGIRYIGKATRTFEGRWICLAEVGNALCRVEVSVRPTVHVGGDPGDEDDQPARRQVLEHDLGREVDGVAHVRLP